MFSSHAFHFYVEVCFSPGMEIYGGTLGLCVSAARGMSIVESGVDGDKQNLMRPEDLEP